MNILYVFLMSLVIDFYLCWRFYKETRSRFSDWKIGRVTLLAFAITMVSTVQLISGIVAWVMYYNGTYLLENGWNIIKFC
ncbi:hypothetical protein PHABIO_118 [Pseudomonas phage Phabio]|uniref:Uncharacterized protein n=1 Tax=Pseudomonas phage Phabio TaxID=2006668 RepID=A0A1Y0SZ16_9CAUD|nr:hypothetical protein MZD05_gp118 [Pseudomonas phage Phabio]ARV76749.1 hypothetical protein PHABIO_118 [Pseudomonas phage Phabio]